MISSPIYTDSGSLRFLSFGIDAGKVSGWAISDSTDLDDLIESGTAKTPSDRLYAINLAKSLRDSTGYPLVVVAETWPGRWPSHKAAMGLGRNWGRWLDYIELALGIKESDMLRCSPAKWRNTVFEPEMVREARGEKDGYKRLACSWAGVKEHNQAEAIAICLWSQIAEEGQEAARKAYAK